LRLRASSVFLGVLASVLLAACGGASGPTPTTATAAGSRSAGASATTAAGSASAAEHAATSTAARAFGPSSSSGPRLPATFTITAGGSLTPPTVSSPASVPVELTLVSGDGRAHRVVLASATRRSLAVPAAGRASMLVAGLKVGRYAIVVDGTARGTLVIGVNPGP
jgi:hypothetical protein